MTVSILGFERSCIVCGVGFSLRFYYCMVYCTLTKTRRLKPTPHEGASISTSGTFPQQCRTFFIASVLTRAKRLYSLSKFNHHAPLCQCVGRKSWTQSDRRRDLRVNACAWPYGFVCLTIRKLPEHLAESENMSQNGIYFLTSVPLEIGMPVELLRGPGIFGPPQG